MGKLISKDLMEGKEYNVEHTVGHICEAYQFWAGEFRDESQALSDEKYLLLFPTEDSFKVFCDGTMEERYSEMERLLSIIEGDSFKDEDDLFFYLGQTVSSFEMALEFLRHTEEWLLCNGEAIEDAERINIEENVKEAWGYIEEYKVWDKK